MTPLKILNEYWGYENFRELQEDIIDSVVKGQDTVALLPTGGGKSICFQVPALMLEGTCLVVSPLIALMQDQIRQLKSRDIPAIALHSGMSYRELNLELENAARGRYKFLYVSPERLQSRDFRTWLKSMDISLIAVDEAHCISQWGFDFRPEYRSIANLRPEFSNAPIIALTASATPAVLDDITVQLNLNSAQVFKKSFVRDNISLSLFNLQDKSGKLIHILESTTGTAIVYVRNRKKCREIAEVLTQRGISASYYHAGLSSEERSLRQEAWINNKIRCIVCTNAFGMGIDKADVRTVIHESPPEDLESFYQESGRAGRDGKKSYAVMLFNQHDQELSETFFNYKFPKPEIIENIANAVYNHFQIASGAGNEFSSTFNFSKFCDAFKLNRTIAHHTLKLLETQKLFHISEAVYTPSRLKAICSYNELYSFRVKYEKYDSLIDSLLRTSQGMFDKYITIHESQIAKQLKIPVEQVKRQLLFLTQSEVLDYKPSTQEPSIFFLQDRPSYMNIDMGIINRLKEASLKRTDALQSYLSNTEICRMNMLVNYFGDEKTEPCGICDICVQSKPGMSEDRQIAACMQDMRMYMSSSSMKLRNIEDVLSSFNQKIIHEALRKLMDDGIIERNPNTEEYCLKKEE
jgi:ATP-dependent DNA helicase RecQ